MFKPHQDQSFGNRTKLLTTALSSAVVLFFVLFESLFRQPTVSRYLPSALNALSLFDADRVQNLMFWFFAVYIVVFLIWKTRLIEYSSASRNDVICLGFLLFCCLLQYRFGQNAKSANILLGSIFLGLLFKIVEVYHYASVSEIKGNTSSDFIKWITGSIVILLTLATFIHGIGTPSYQYGNSVRWCGPWVSPNVAGLLMGGGATLAFGLVLNTALIDGREKAFVRIAKVCALMFFLEILMSSLILSFSRGAWIATTIGFTCIAFRSRNWKSTKRITELGKTIEGKFYWFITVFAVCACLWHLRKVESATFNRAMSVGNSADFSWRNRLVAWEGALQIMAEHPWSGVGWEQPLHLYQNYYLPPKLVEGDAIEMNDYLILGATFGIPCFLLLGTNFWFNLFYLNKKPENFEEGSANHLKLVCHSAVIVLLVGFCFDGGLFKLPTSALFWILYELGICANRKALP